MAETQAAVESLALYFNTLMLLAKVAVACLLTDTVVFVTLMLVLWTRQMRRN